MPGGSCGLFPSLVKQREERDAENRSMNGYIREALGTPEILAQLAEEAAELSQAALKYRTLTSASSCATCRSMTRWC